MVNRRHPASPITQCAVLTERGYCWAALGEIEPCRRDMGWEAEDYPTAMDIAPPWHWTRHAPDTQIAAFIAEKHGNTLELLSRSHPEFAPATIEQLRIAVDSYDEGASRARAVELPYLASAYFRAGDLDCAVATGHEALTAMSELSSTLAYTELSLVAAAAAAAPFGHKTQVVELRARIRAAVAATAS